MRQMAKITSQKFKFRMVLLLMAILAGFAAGAFAQNDNQQADKLSSRPRLFFTSGCVKRLQERAKEDSVFKEASGKILERADRLLNAKLVSIKHYQKIIIIK